MTPKKVRKAVFPVGGLGTRFLPATKSLPKEMLPVVDKPLIQYAFEEAVAAGIEQFIFVTGRNKNAISNHFDHSYELQRTLDDKKKQVELDKVRGWLPEAGHIFFVRQQQPLGLGHAIWCARHLLENEPFAVLLADEMLQSDPPCLKQMLDVYDQTGGSLVAVMDIAQELTSHYGILDVEKTEGRLVKAKGLVEKPAPKDAPSTISICGRYILQPEIFNYLEGQQQGTGGEIQLTDAMHALAQTDEVRGFLFHGQRFDCGSRIGYLEANIAYALKDEELHDRMVSMLQHFAGIK